LTPAAIDEYQEMLYDTQWSGVFFDLSQPDDKPIFFFHDKDLLKAFKDYMKIYYPDVDIKLRVYDEPDYGPDEIAS